MKCSFEKCNNESTCGIGWGTSVKGYIPLCKDCAEHYHNHVKARESYFKK